MGAMLNARTRRAALGGLALALSLLSLSLASQAVAVTPVPAKPNAKASEALRVAERAKLIGQRALRRTNRALEVAIRARKAVRILRARADAAKVGSATVAGEVTTSSESAYVDLGGPSVTVDVPASGLAEVWATVTFGAPNDGLVGLYVDGQPAPMDQDGLCGSADIEDALLSTSTDTGTPITLSTPSASFLPLGCGIPGSAPGPMMVETTPGEHTFSLRYADCGCDPGDATFSGRTLRVAGRE